jgi:hypothetical protein
MINKYILGHKELQIKTTLRFHLPASQDGYHQENKQQQMLLKMQGVGWEGPS